MTPKNRETFDRLLRQITSQGGPDPVRARLAEFLKSEPVMERFCSAPASTAHRFHHAHEGGLLEHTFEVLKLTGAALGAVMQIGWSERDVALAAVLHDIGKIGLADGTPIYSPNILKSGKRSDAIPYEISESARQKRAAFQAPANDNIAAQARALLSRNPDAFPDGELSLSLVCVLAPDLFAMLNEDVLFAIRHHDGKYGKAGRELAGQETPLMLALHFADMISSRASAQAYKERSAP
jgi:hypothetical protein